MDSRSLHTMQEKKKNEKCNPASIELDPPQEEQQENQINRFRLSSH